MSEHYECVRGRRFFHGGRALVLVAWMAASLLAGSLSETLAQRPDVIGGIPTEMLQPRVARPRGDVLRRLERLEWLAEHQSWDEVCDLADELLADATDGWMAAESDRYVGVRQAVHRRLAALPPAGLAAFRARVDAIADDWLRQGIENRDERLLRQVADRAFCSAAGDEALWALGEMALERGECQAARRAWQSLHAETAIPGTLVYPDASVPLADVVARLALVSIREGDFDRAKREIAKISAQHGDAVGRLGGREVNYASRLGELLEQARALPNGHDAAGWPTLFGNSQRTNVSAIETPVSAEFKQAWSVELPAATTEPGGQPHMFPVVADDAIVFQDASGVYTMPISRDATAPVVRRLYAAPNSTLSKGSLSLTVHDRKAFAVVVTNPESAERPTSQLIGLDLARDGALLFQLTPEQESARFLGPPVVRGSRVLVGELTPAQGMRKASVLCVDQENGAIVWRRTLGWSFDLGALGVSLPPAMVLAEDAGVVFVNTNMGLIAAIRIDDGEPLWLRTYSRSIQVGEPGVLMSTGRAPNPCVALRSRAIVSPNDANEIFALDAATGAELWTTPLPAAEVRILAVDGNQVFLSGERLWALDAATGEIDAAWGGEPAGGVGQGVAAGELVFWPTMGDILLVDRATGKLTGRSLPLPTAGGANLVVCKVGETADEYILAAGSDRLTAYRRTGAAAAPARNDE